jgi:hypothetical protein
MACGLSRLEFDFPSALSVWVRLPLYHFWKLLSSEIFFDPSAIISQKVVRVKWFPSGSEKFSVWKICLVLYQTFGVLSSKKAAAGKNFFVKCFFNFFKKFFPSDRTTFFSICQVKAARK